MLGMMVVVKLDGSPLLCKTDEVGELCLSGTYGRHQLLGPAGRL